MFSCLHRLIWRLDSRTTFSSGELHFVSSSVLSLLFTKSVRKCTAREWTPLSPTRTLTSSETGTLWREESSFCLTGVCCLRLRCVHRLVGGLLSLSPDYGFVLEDDEGICGYALGTEDVKPFIKKCEMSWIPFMQEKYHKPDEQKDLSEAEVRALVGSSSVPASEHLHVSVVPAEDDAEFP